MVILGEKPWVKYEPHDDYYGRFIAEPLERGYGSTLGNTLRRVLLSSLVGAAVTSIRIENVAHEFSTIPNVVEDVLQLILNIKQLVIRSHSDVPKIIKLEAHGKGLVTAKDIKHDAEIEIVNPDQPIATLEAGGKLNIEMVVEKGKGFVVGERNKKANQPLGTIPVDSIFTPVRKVNLTIEEVRVGQEINYDRLVLDVWTNGSIKPDEAVKASAKILERHIDMFINMGERADELQIEIKGSDDLDNAVLEMSVDELELSARSLNCLKKSDINKIRDLVQLTEDDLDKIKNLGSKSSEEIKESLSRYNLNLKGAQKGEEK
ncbi:MAG: DNA-directed RNA polymerase subunit alpha [Candidatus Margulisiibacteriota bacterium]